MRPLRTENDIEKAVHTLSFPLYHMMEGVKDQVPVPADHLKVAIAAAMPWRQVPDIIWVFDARMRLHKGEITLGEALQADLGKTIDNGLRAALQPVWKPYVANLLVFALAWLMLRTAGVSSMVCLGYFFVHALACHLLIKQWVRGRVETVKKTYARVLNPVFQLCDNVQRGTVPLPEAYGASRGHILYAYMGLRLAGKDRKAEMLLPLFELGLLGTHVIGFDPEGRAFVSIPPTVRVDDEVITDKWQRPVTVSP